MIKEIDLLHSTIPVIAIAAVSSKQLKGIAKSKRASDIFTFDNKLKKRDT